MAGTQHVVFSINQQLFGIEIFKIKEVLNYRKITPLPQVEGFIKGIINVRGAIIPVFDLREKFNFPAMEYTRFHVIIVVEISGRIMGVIVDEISDVLEILQEEFQTTENLPSNLQREYLKGVGKKQDEMIILLDMDRLLSPEELELVDAA
ncbi:MAG: purine-binding chemotaxis protein CheW [Desulfobacteraceae bacterium]|uniref:Purine-binding chemotaxis protein CheW n=1 Tax=Candidatus Desulfaltia bathyphila TaxID=2841697 RepID=A0A8J6TC38_9BACT|nr:purine-binding chemotaxis protein CheW [Candidatus Desulfaltia bathyphila]MBL7195111.1 purine-binding chemotaxis protein CheW [Desulfobacterales bacterium]